MALTEQGDIGERVESAIAPTTKVIGIQRSRGYDWRSSFTVAQIGEMVSRIRSIREDVIVFVDNCYGEFTERLEPTEVGVDLMAGSLIKNPGGGIAETGGYICGKAAYVEQAAYRLTAPESDVKSGLCWERPEESIRAYSWHLPPSAKPSREASMLPRCLKPWDLRPPGWQDERTDLIQAVSFSGSEHLIAFVQGIQRAAAVDSHVVPELGTCRDMSIR